MKKLKELLSGISINAIHGAKIDNELISSIAYHSAQVRPGTLFVCIKGYKTDGHQFLSDALARGAKAAIVERIMEEVDIPQYVTEDSRLALALASSNFYDLPAQKMKMIGVTATNGKTTTTYMINQILEKHGLKTGMVGTVVIKADDEFLSSELTTPQSLDLQKHLAHMVQKDVSAVTMEVSSSALDLKRVGGIDYDIGVFNNISREHIDLHETFDNYLKIKSSLITDLGKQAVAVLNADQEECYRLKEQAKSAVVTYSVESDKGDLTCQNLDLSTGRGTFLVRLRPDHFLHKFYPDDSSFEIKLKVPGYHSVYNAMAAITVGMLCQIPISTIQQALWEFSGVERRFELIYEEDIKIFDDHFANAGNIDVTLGTLEKMDYSTFILIYAIRGSRGPIVNRENAKAICKWAKILDFDTVYATLSRSHTGEKDWVTEEEVSALKEVLDSEGIRLELYDEIKDVCSKGLDIAKEGDVILLAGCQGMDFGASIMLREIYERHPNLDKKNLFRPLENRVCGVE